MMGMRITIASRMTNNKTTMTMMTVMMTTTMMNPTMNMMMNQKMIEHRLRRKAAYFSVRCFPFLAYERMRGHGRQSDRMLLHLFWSHLNG